MKTFTRREYNLVVKCLDYYETFMTNDDKKLSQIIQDKLYYFNVDKVTETNNNSEELIKMSEERGKGILLKTGVLVTETGLYRGRAADAKFYVKDKITRDTIDWASNNSMTEEQFSNLFAEFRDYKENMPELFCQEVSAVRDSRHGLDVVVYTETAKHALFARNMFIPGSRTLNVGDAFFVL